MEIEKSKKKICLIHPEIDRENIAGMRDVLIHSFFGVKYRIVWDVLKTHILILYNRIKEILINQSHLFIILYIK